MRGGERRGSNAASLSLVLMVLVVGLPLTTGQGLVEQVADEPLGLAAFVAQNYDQGYYAERRALIDHGGPLFSDLLLAGGQVVYHGWTDVASDVQFTWTDPSGATELRSRHIDRGQFIEVFTLGPVTASSNAARVAMDTVGASAGGIQLHSAIDITFDDPAAVDYVPPPWEASRWLYVAEDVAIQGARNTPECCLLSSNMTASNSTASQGTFSTMSAPCSNCVQVTGTIKFDWWINLPCAQCRVEIWESHGQNNPSMHRQLDDVISGYDYVRTNAFGDFSVWVSDVEWGQGGIDPYVAVDLWDDPDQRVSMRFPDEVGAARPTVEDIEYYYRHGKAQNTNCLAGSTCSLGTITIRSAMNIADGTTSSGEERLGQLSQHWVDAALARFKMLDASARLDGAALYDPDQLQVGFPADAVTSVCGQTTNVDTAVFYRSCNGDTAVLLGQDSAKNSFTVAHEYGHHVMWEAFGNTGWPNPPPPDVCPHPHPRGSASPVECAWKEGWAEFYSLVAVGSPNRMYRDGSTIPFNCFGDNGDPPATWHHDGSPAQGQLVEGRITAALWDFVDAKPCGGYSSDDDGVNRNTKWAVWRPMIGSGLSTSFNEYHNQVATARSDWGADLRTAAAHNGVTV